MRCHWTYLYLLVIMATYNTIFYIGSSRQNSVSGGDGTEAPSASPTQTVESEAMQTTAAVMTSSDGGEQTTQQQITQHTEMVCVTSVHMYCYMLSFLYRFVWYVTFEYL